MDLFVVPTIGVKLLYAFVILRLDRRNLVWISVTPHPTADWVARQITEAFPWDEAPRYMIRDRDCIYGVVVTRRLRAMGIRDKPIAPASPWQNGIAERLIGSPGNPSEISGFPAGTPGDFVNPLDALVLGWNQYRIEVNNNVIKVALNGTNTAQYTIPDPATVNFPPPWDQRRGRYPASEPTFIGLQSYSKL
jgi:hypothetical protein